MHQLPTTEEATSRSTCKHFQSQYGFQETIVVDVELQLGGRETLPMTEEAMSRGTPLVKHFHGLGGLQETIVQQPQQQGYNTDSCTIQSRAGWQLNLEDLQRYRCVSCKYILRDPCQFVCGDRICEACLPSRPFECPSCGEHIDPSKPQQYFSDKSCLNDIKGFTVVCKCGQKCSLDDWEVHQESCPEVTEKSGAAGQSAILMKHIQVELKQLSADVTEIKKVSSKALRKTESLEKELQRMKSALDDLQGLRVGTHESSGAKPMASGDVELRPQVKRLNEKYAQLNEIVTNVVSDVEQHKGTIAHMNTTVDHISQVIPRYESILEEMNLKIEILEVKSTSGTYVWKINELSRRSREARIGKTVSLYSPPFYTSPHGYRLCLRAYLYGDGTGKGTHISLFVVLMRSEYDDVLTWPFRHRVSLSLINQDKPLSNEAAIMHKFIPNPESSSFHKPRDTFNIASGFPEFAPLSVLNDNSFVKNDTIYFRVKLEPPDVPTGPDNII